MSVRLGPHQFRGPHVSSLGLENLPGIYAVLSVLNGQVRLVDVGQAEEVRREVETNGRLDLWKEQANGAGLGFAVLYTGEDAESRGMIVDDIRRRYGVAATTAAAREKLS
jgi:hypothetical protein